MSRRYCETPYSIPSFGAPTKVDLGVVSSLGGAEAAFQRAVQLEATAESFANSAAVREYACDLLRVACRVEDSLPQVSAQDLPTGEYSALVKTQDGYCPESISVPENCDLDPLSYIVKLTAYGEVSVVIAPDSKVLKRTKEGRWVGNVDGQKYEVVTNGQSMRDDLRTGGL